jgi:hypothetical protein
MPKDREATLSPTPLQPREFFDGKWSGRGEIRYRWWLRLFRQPQRFRYTSTGEWLSDTQREFRDLLEFESGGLIATTLTCHLLGKDRLHVRCPAMPGGADIVLTGSGYTFTPYWWRTNVGPFTLRLRCLDVNTVDQDGVIHNRVDIRWLRIPLATLTMTIKVDRSGSQ